MKMRFGVGMGRTESVNKVGEHARIAENSGFEHVTLVDEPFLARDVFTALVDRAGAEDVGNANAHSAPTGPSVVRRVVRTLSSLKLLR